MAGGVVGCRPLANVSAAEHCDVSESFFTQPVLNSPYEYPARHWMLQDGVPTDHVMETRRAAEYVTAVVPRPRRRRGEPPQGAMTLGVEGLSTAEQEYDPTPIINSIRRRVDEWRANPAPSQWRVSPATQRLLQHWRGMTHEFQGVRPFFCQVEAAETVIWLTEVTGILGGSIGSNSPLAGIRRHLEGANKEANPDLLRIALKLATGAGKTTVMAMLIAWQAVNAARSPNAQTFTNSFLIVTPGITIRDRLRVLHPNDPDNYYEHRDLVPKEMLGAIRQARVVITNYHAFRRRETENIAKATRALVKGRRGAELKTTESEGQMLRRVMPELLGGKRPVFVLNDEGHHCYREKPDTREEEDLAGEEKDEARKNNEAARLWITGVETVKSRIGVRNVIDLSATPFFLRGSGYAEGTLFPWTVNDFSLMDAIECGIVKVPRVPVADNAPGLDSPVYRNLWERIRNRMPRKGRRKAESLDPLKLPAELQSALDALYSHYDKVFEQWREAGIPTPPVFIVVCNNTATSKLVYEYISGFAYPERDGFTPAPFRGHLPLFSNYDESGARLRSPRTLLIDSEQLESGDALDKDFRAMEADAIEQFRRERAQRAGAAGDAISDADLLREVMNTIGKEGRLGANIRCVVSVSMLTEGWDANTVTHILGVRAFGTQLLCEQVVGRALRRQNYDLGDDGRLDAEYADVLGIPFDFTAKPVVAPPKPPASVVRVRAVSPERDPLEIVFPRVAGYRRELPEDRLDARFDRDSVLTLTPELVGPSITRNEGIVGEGVTLTPEYLAAQRKQTIAYHLALRLLDRHFRNPGDPPPMHLFSQLRSIAVRWIKEGYLRCEGDTYRAQLLYREIADRAVERINTAITAAALQDETAPPPVVKAVLDPYNPDGSTRHVNFTTSKKLRWETRDDKSHVNWAVCDSEWEAEFCRVAEEDPRVLAYVKNQGLGFGVPYYLGETEKTYVPDFIVLLDDGGGWDDPLHVVVETKGYRREDDVDKQNAMRSFWTPGVNALGKYGRWTFVELARVWEMQEEFERVSGQPGPASLDFKKMLEYAPLEDLDLTREKDYGRDVSFLYDDANG